MTLAWTKAVSLTPLASAACAPNGVTNEAADEGNAETAAAPERRQESNQPAATSSGSSGAAAEGTSAAASILSCSRPAGGSTVSAPVDELVFHFSPVARLAEVTVTGPEGTMPMMFTAVGEVERYSLPISATASGAYTVTWRATARGVDHRGTFGFEVR